MLSSISEDVPSAEQVKAMTATLLKTYENRSCRIASRQLLTLQQTRRRDRLAHDYGSYALVDKAGKVIGTGSLRDVHKRVIRG